jgi:fructokinase
MGNRTSVARKFAIVGLGEVLWDLLPSGKQLGGAPTNFAYISTILGDRGIVASRLGEDLFGTEAEERLKKLGVEISYLQEDESHPTGTVDVQLNRGGQPRFTIRKNVAWDFLSFTETWEKLAKNVDAVCFGTLAQRSARSQTTLARFLQITRGIRIFDVNLRQNFYCAEILRRSIGLATIVKMNHDELPLVLKLLKMRPRRGEVSAGQLLEFGPKLVCITRGSRGSLLLTETARDEHPGFKVRVRDTIGAGDAFTAGLVREYLREASLKKMNDTANRIASWVASRAGGTPELKSGNYRGHKNEFEAHLADRLLRR